MNTPKGLVPAGELIVQHQRPNCVNRIHIKTACGSRGNCGKCRVRIVDGNCAINTMDRVWFTEEQLAKGYRLGCQVYAKEQLVIDLLCKS